MNINIILEEIIESISIDVDLFEWCNTNYSKLYTIYNGIDLRKPPTEIECPVISLAAISKDPNESQTKVSHVIGVVCEIYDKSPPTSTTSISGVIIKKYPGISKIEEFRKAVEKSITSIDFNSIPDLVGLRCDGIKIDFDTITVFPFFRAFMEVYFVNYFSQGEDTYA